MNAYFEAPDGHGASTIWTIDGNPARPAMPVIRELDVTPGCWPNVVARMTGTTITTDDATMGLIADALLYWTGERDAELAEHILSALRAGGV